MITSLNDIHTINMPRYSQYFERNRFPSLFLYPHKYTKIYTRKYSNVGVFEHAMAPDTTHIILFLSCDVDANVIIFLYVASESSLQIEANRACLLEWTAEFPYKQFKTLTLF